MSFTQQNSYAVQAQARSGYAARSHGRKWLLLVSVALFCLSLLRYWPAYDPDGAVHRDPESFRLARNILDHGTFANPFVAGDTGASAHLAPMLPLFFALLLKLFGAGSRGLYVIQLCAVLVLSLQIAFFPLASRALGMGEFNGVVASLIWIVGKPQYVFGWEAGYVALLLVVTVPLYRIFLSRPFSNLNMLPWILGTLFGVLLLFSPSVLPLVALAVAWAAWSRGIRPFMREALIPLVLLPGLMIAPWTIRNYIALDHFVPIRDNLGLELSVSNNDCAAYSLELNLNSGCFEKVHPNLDEHQAKEMSELGEVEYNQVQMKRFRDWAATHPSRFVVLTVQRILFFWFPTDTGSIHIGRGRHLERIVVYLVTLLSFFGLKSLFRIECVSAMICFACLAVFPLVYYLTQFEARYRYPILWISFLLGSFPLTKLGRELAQRKGWSPRRIAA